MRYSNIIGLISALVLIWACTQKWVYINSPEYYLSGFESTLKQNNFGRPGKLHLYLSIIASILFIIPKIWAKRTNFVFTALNVAWGVRNFFAIGLTCRAGICPNRELGIYLVFICSIIMFVMALLPKLAVTPTKK